ncbi:hypothetical protein OG474_29250 [Kribbella sp. NBC_01505]|uniref:hypothetical protein n=1 Tax=Kribbella sp. NBC_01505 TaxID=2903580 RepID=UPI00386901B2
MAKTLSPLTSLPIFNIGASVGEGSKYALGQIQDRALAELGKAPKSSYAQDYKAMDETSRKALADSVRNMLLQAG